MLENFRFLIFFNDENCKIVPNFIVLNHIRYICVIFLFENTLLKFMFPILTIFFLKFNFALIKKLFRIYFKFPSLYLHNYYFFDIDAIMFGKINNKEKNYSAFRQVQMIIRRKKRKSFKNFAFLRV